MLKWTVPVWRRWDWHRWRRAYIAQTPKAERRAWVRYPCKLETNCKSETDRLGCPATVRNISLGGMSLQVDRQFESGTLIRVQVQSALENTPHMLCLRVIHVTSQPDGTWLLGCAFARELSDDSLRAFRAARVRPMPPDNRSWKRFLCNIMTSCKSVEPAQLEPAAAKILNVSAAGLGLLVTRAFDQGTLVSVELPGSNGHIPTSILARVIHVKPQVSGDWVLGCAFTRRFTEQELQMLL